MVVIFFSLVTQKCSTDVFIDSLVEPALLCGELSKLLDQMLMLDTSLDRWSVYLTTTCRHLLKQRLFNSLYHVQLFMKVSFQLPLPRAALHESKLMDMFNSLYHVQLFMKVSFQLSLPRAALHESKLMDMFNSLYHMQLFMKVSFQLSLPRAALHESKFSTLSTTCSSS